MGANKFFFSQVRKGLNLLADYQFNNNLIDDANGYNLTGTDITYNNGSAVFNGTTSVASRVDTNDLFSFTNGVRDLPFRIETRLSLQDLNRENQIIVSKRGALTSLFEWQLIYANSTNGFRFNISSNGGTSNLLNISKQVTGDSYTFFNIVVTYGGNGINGLNMVVDGVDADTKSEIGNYDKMVKTNSDFAIGKASWINLYQYNGKIDYLKIYK